MDRSVKEMAQLAKQASYGLALLSAEEKNVILVQLSQVLLSATEAICSANALDLAAAKEQGMSEAMLDRLLLNEERIQHLSQSVLTISYLPDPVGEIIDGHPLQQNLFMMRKRVPLGVVAAIYESRPNVTIDMAALCLKSGNAVILRGAKEAFHTNLSLLACVHSVLAVHNIPLGAVQAVRNMDREYTRELLQQDAYIDILIPRGGMALQDFCREHSRIPLILGGIGVCHVYVDSCAKIEESLLVIENGKVQRPSVCNALETVLIDEKIAAEFIPRLYDHLREYGLTFHASKSAQEFFTEQEGVVPLIEEDFSREWLSLDLNVHVVTDLDEAIFHIRRYGSGHSEAILTESMGRAQYFTQSVDAAAVYVNASTRFTDGGEFGLGAEVAVSTQKLHARGPFALEALTTYKWICQGSYSIR